MTQVNALPHVNSVYSETLAYWQLLIVLTSVNRRAAAGRVRGGRGGGRALQDVVDGGQGDQDERDGGVEQRDHDGDRVHAAAADEPQPRGPVRLRRERHDPVIAVQGPLEDHA